ncbi:MAG: hypothetical protein ABI263_02090 [Gelidibacter sp.]
MKKVILTAAILLGGLSTYATPVDTMNQANGVAILIQQEFKEIQISELPQAVQDALVADLETATLHKAYVNAEQEYKLEVTLDGTSLTLYADKDGNWIEKE